MQLDTLPDSQLKTLLHAVQQRLALLPRQSPCFAAAQRHLLELKTEAVVRNVTEGKPLPWRS